MIGWENHSWKYMSSIGDERIINLQRTKVYVFSDSVLCLGKIFENPQSNGAWEERMGWITTSQSYRDFDGIDGELTKFEWNIFPGLEYVAALRKSEKFTEQIRRNTRKFHRKNSINVDVQRHFLWNKRQRNRVWQTLDSDLCMRENLVKDNGHLLVLVLKRSGILSVKTVTRNL